MRTNSVIKSFDIGEDGRLRLCSCYVVVEIDQLAFEAAEEIFRNSIVVGIAFAGHALEKPKAFKPVTVIKGSILAAAIRVENQPFGRSFSIDGHIQG